MEEIYGYGYVTKPTQNILRSTVYKSLRGRFIPQENIYIDVLLSDDSRAKLKELIGRAHTGDTIVILNRRTLGNTNEFRKWWQELTFGYPKINLLIINDDEPDGADYYSTTNFSFRRYSEKEIAQRWERLQNDTFERKTNKVGRKVARINDVFLEAYWAFQSFFITSEEAYEHAGVSKQTFYTLCKAYEATEEYKEVLLAHTELYEYPKRGGITTNIEKLLFAVEQRGMKLEEACKELGLSEMLPEEYHRYLLAKVGGRKIQFEMEKTHHIENYFKDRK